MRHERRVAASVFPQAVQVVFCAFDFVFINLHVQVPAPKQTTEPRTGRVRISFRSWITEWRVSHTIEILNNRMACIGLSADAAQGRNNKTERALQFVAAQLLKILCGK